MTFLAQEYLDDLVDLTESLCRTKVMHECGPAHSRLHLSVWTEEMATDLFTHSDTYRLCVRGNIDHFEFSKEIKFRIDDLPTYTSMYAQEVEEALEEHLGSPPICRRHLVTKTETNVPETGYACPFCYWEDHR